MSLDSNGCYWTKNLPVLGIFTIEKRNKLSKACEPKIDDNYCTFTNSIDCICSNFYRKASKQNIKLISYDLINLISIYSIQTHYFN